MLYIAQNKNLIFFAYKTTMCKCTKRKRVL